MFDIFCTPKAFTDPHVSLIQTNAIRSWRAAMPDTQLMVFGNDAGVPEFAQANGLRHVGGLQSKASGAPLLSDLFAKAERFATSDYLCYINSDIILTSDFARVVSTLASSTSRFLMIGGRTNLDVLEEIDYTDPSWEVALRERAQRDGDLLLAGMDYFVYPRGTFTHIPQFAIGGTAFDNWLVWRARRDKVAVIDVTTEVLAIHQNHPGHWAQINESENAIQNRTLLNSWQRSFTIKDATFEFAGGTLDSRRLQACRHRCGVGLDLILSGSRRRAGSTLRRIGLKRTDRDPEA